MLDEDPVNFVDYAVFASYLGATDCENSDNCEGSDLDCNGLIDPNDLAVFCDEWLRGGKYIMPLVCPEWARNVNPWPPGGAW